MKKLNFWLGKALVVAFSGSAIALLICLARLKMLPGDLLMTIGLLLGLIIALVLVLTWSGQGKFRMTAGVLLGIVMTVVLSAGTFYIQKALDTIENISGVTTETVHVGIYVRKEDAETYNQKASSCQYGILQKLDRESTDSLLKHINQTLETEVVCREYPKLPELVDGLLNRQVDAIILNQAFLDVLQEMEGYENILDSIREVVLKQVVVEIDKPTQPEPSASEETDSTEPVVETDPAKKPFGIYISGIDTYGKVSVRSRSDVNILAVVNPATRQVVLISTPRDYFVPLSISEGIPDKLTHAGIYGVNVSKDTLGMLYGIDMDYYFRVNFSGFQEIIDALGGVVVNSEVSFAKKGYYFHKGENYLDGKAALVFCRERYAFASGDRQRGKNQMAVVKAVINKAMSSALLANYAEVLKALEGSFETSMPIEVMGALVANQLKTGGRWNVVTYSVDGTGDSRIPYSMSQYAYVMQPDFETVEHAKKLIQSVINGEILDS